MARPKKQTVDYFPHQCNHGKTIYILEQRYGNDGYAFWFKLLETIGTSEGHFIDCKNEEVWEFLQAKTRTDQDKCREILDLLAKLEAIDRDLWTQECIVWSGNFIDGVREAYRNRTVKIPDRPSFQRKKSLESEDNLRQKSANEMKVNEMKVNETIGRKKFVAPTLEQVREYCLERGNSLNPEKIFDYYVANGWTQGKGKPLKDWKAAIRTCEHNDKERKNETGERHKSFSQRKVEQNERVRQQARSLLGIPGGSDQVSSGLSGHRNDGGKAANLSQDLIQIPQVETVKT